MQSSTDFYFNQVYQAILLQKNDALDLILKEEIKYIS